VEIFSFAQDTKAASKKWENIPAQLTQLLRCVEEVSEIDFGAEKRTECGAGEETWHADAALLQEATLRFVGRKFFRRRLGKSDLWQNRRERRDAERRRQLDGWPMSFRSGADSTDNRIRQDILECAVCRSDDTYL